MFRLAAPAFLSVAVIGSAHASELITLRAPIDDPIFKSTQVGIWKASRDAASATPKWNFDPFGAPEKLAAQVNKLACLVKGGTRVRLLERGQRISRVRFNRKRCEGFAANKFIE